MSWAAGSEDCVISFNPHYTTLIRADTLTTHTEKPLSEKVNTSQWPSMLPLALPKPLLSPGRRRNFSLRIAGSSPSLSRGLPRAKLKLFGPFFREKGSTWYPTTFWVCERVLACVRNSRAPPSPSSGSQHLKWGHHCKGGLSGSKPPTYTCPFLPSSLSLSFLSLLIYVLKFPID